MGRTERRLGESVAGAGKPARAPAASRAAAGSAVRGERSAREAERRQVARWGAGAPVRAGQLPVAAARRPAAVVALRGAAATEPEVAQEGALEAGALEAAALEVEEQSTPALLGCAR